MLHPNLIMALEHDFSALWQSQQQSSAFNKSLVEVVEETVLLSPKHKFDIPSDHMIVLLSFERRQVKAA